MCHPIPLPSLHDGQAYSSGCVPTDYMFNPESVVGIKPSDSDVVIRYEFGKSTHTWSAEHFSAQSHIYPGLLCKV